MKDDKINAEQAAERIAFELTTPQQILEVGFVKMGFLAGVQWKEEQATEQRRKDFEAGFKANRHDFNYENGETVSGAFDSYLKSI